MCKMDGAEMAPRVCDGVLVGRARRVGAEVGRGVGLQQGPADRAHAGGRAARARRHAVAHARRAEDAPAVPAVHLLLVVG